VRAAVPREPDYQVNLQLNLREATAEFERAHILRIIEQCGGNKRKAAKLLGLGVTSLYRKLGSPIGNAEM
jgi:DNA-binding NtrC family response regulator